MHSKLFRSSIAALALFYIAPAMAIEYSHGPSTFKLTGYGTAGVIEPDFETPNFVGDWRVRGEFGFDANAANKLGLVYAIDANAVDDEKYMREGFAFWQSKSMGRLEFGFTDSVARKLSVGLPDVGGLRVNDKPLFYKKITPNGPVISDTIMTTGRDALRLNWASLPMRGVQYGLSVAGITDDYDYAIDVGLRIRDGAGKTKTAFALAASFMGRPDGYKTASYAPLVTADWRAQLATGVNVQYNSWMFALDARLIYDENPIGTPSDGLAVGAGVSYDILNYSISGTYILSDTAVWHHDVDDYIDHTGVVSFRYKYSPNVDLWVSLGITSDTPFLSTGLRLTF